MISLRNFLSLVIVFFSLTSCIITNSIRTIQIEILKPGMFVFPEDINKVALFKRDLYQTDTCIFRYYFLGKVKVDSTIKYRDLSNNCIDALAINIEKEGYFQKVHNYRDSLNYLWIKDHQLSNVKELFEKTNSDFCIFLDHFFLTTGISSTYYKIFIEARLSWTLSSKTDTFVYVFNQVDTLIYDDPVIKDPKSVMMNASEYLGKAFVSKIIPSWLPVERVYYKSSNPNMQNAEKYALKNDWLKAAEIWKRETKNKNHRIAAKACYNMALTCEMEGKQDAAIDWLIKSYKGLSMNAKEHRTNCQRYINVLTIRKKEIGRLDKQIRIPENIQKMNNPL